MPWNSRTSSPSGVTISITLVMTSLGIDVRPFHAGFDPHRDRPRIIHPRPPPPPPAPARFCPPRGRILPRAYPQAGDRNAGLHPQISLTNLGHEFVIGEQPLDITARIPAPPVGLSGVAGRPH